jgi:hypothetical protein
MRSIIVSGFFFLLHLVLSFISYAQDKTPPVAIAHESITLYLDDNGIVTLTAQEVNNGSFDDQTPAGELKFYLDRMEFGCEDTKGIKEWRFLGENGVSERWTYNSKIIFAPDRTPYLIFIDDYNSRKVAVYKWANETWDLLGGSLINSGFDTQSLDAYFSANGELYLSYSIAFSNEIKVLKWDGSSWLALGDHIGEGTVSFTHFAISQEGIPYLTFVDRGYNKKIRVLEWVEEVREWIDIKNPFWTMEGEFIITDMDISSDGSIFLSFYDRSSSGKSFIYQFDGKTWKDLGGFSVIAKAYINQQMALSPNGALYLFYENFENPRRVSVLEYKEGEWHELSPFFTNGENPYYSRLVFDYFGNLFISYSTSQFGFLRVKRWNSNMKAWEEEENAGLNNIQIQNQSLAIDQAGEKYIIFSDWHQYNSSKLYATKLYDSKRLTLTVEDNAGNKSFAVSQLNVIEKNVPVAKAKEILLPIYFNNMARLAPEEVDAGSTDDCGIRRMSLSKSIFYISEIGEHEAILFVEDWSGNIGEATFKVIVKDAISPIAKSIPKVNGSLDERGKFVVKVSDIENGSSDNLTSYGNLKFNLTKSEFTCEDIEATEEWQKVGDEIEADYVGLAIAYTMAPDGTPYLAFRDKDALLGTTVVKLVDNKWMVVGTRGVSYGRGAYHSLSVATDGTVYLTYLDEHFGYNATVQRFKNNKWELLDKHGFTKAYEPKIIVGTDGIPYFSYIENDYTQKLSVLKWEDDQWIPVGGGKGISPAGVSRTAMAVSKEGNLFIACEASYPDSDLYVLKWNGEKWTIVGGQSSIARGVLPNLAIGENETLYLSYEDHSVQNNTQVFQWNGTVWSNLADGISENWNYNSSLSTDQFGNIHIAYEDKVLNRLIVSKWENNKWNKISLQGLEEEFINIQGFSFAPDGTPFIVYYTNSTIPSAVVKKLYHSNRIRMYVEDENGNSSFTGVIVEVVDELAPVAILKDIEISLDKEGKATITFSDIDNGSFDNCGIASWILSKTDFYCEDVGDQNILIAISDPSGNSSEATAKVTVLNPYAAKLELIGKILEASEGDSYTWYKDGIKLKYRSKKISPNLEGVYRVEIGIEGGCTTISNEVEVRDLKTDAPLVLFPNPTSEVLKFVVYEEFNENAQWSIYNIRGEQILNSVVNSLPGEVIDIKLSTIRSGTYFLILTNGDNTYKKVFIKI